MPPNQDDQRGGRGLLLGAVAALLVVGCCALLPLLVVGGTITGIGTLLRNPWVIGVGIALLAIVLLVVVRRRTRRGRVEPDCCPPTESAHRTDPKGEQNQ